MRDWMLRRHRRASLSSSCRVAYRARPRAKLSNLGIQCGSYVCGGIHNRRNDSFRISSELRKMPSLRPPSGSDHSDACGRPPRRRHRFEIIRLHCVTADAVLSADGWTELRMERERERGGSHHSQRRERDDVFRIPTDSFTHTDRDSDTHTHSEGTEREERTWRQRRIWSRWNER